MTRLTYGFGETLTRRRVVHTTDDYVEALGVLMRERAVGHGVQADLVEVRWADPPIRTVHTWAVVRYLSEVEN